MEKISKKIFPILVFGVVAFLGFKLISAILPIIIAYLLAGPLYRLVSRLCPKRGIMRSLLISLFVLLIIAIFVAITIGIIYVIVNQMAGFSSHLEGISDKVLKLINKFPKDGIFKFLHMGYEAIFKNLSKITSVFVSISISGIKMAPKFLIFWLFFSLSLFFFTRDNLLVKSFLKDFFAKHSIPTFTKARKTSGEYFMKYLRAQLTLMTITFVISFIALFILQIPYFPLIALGIAIIDAIPMLGPALVYMPWIGLTLLAGDFNMAAALGVVYLITTLARQLLEPQIVSESFGIHPLFTIITMCASVGIFGVKGVLVGAIIVMFVIVYFKSKESLNEE